MISTPYGFLQTLGCVGQLTVFIVPSYEKEIARKWIFYLGSKIWNDLNQDIRASPRGNSFKHVSKTHFFKF